MRQLNAPSRTVNWGKVILVVALVIPMLASAPAIKAAPRVHPALMQAATQNPTSVVSVIVQKQNASQGVEDAVVRMGGKVTKDLHIINAFAAELPAAAVLQLGSSSDVRWISPDSAIKKSTTTEMFTTWATELGTYAPHSSSANLNGTPVSSTNYLWLNSTVKLTGQGSS